MTKRQPSPIAQIARLGAFAAAGWLLYSRFVIDHDTDLPEAIPAPRERFRSGDALVSYYVDRSGTGVPLVLIHSINAAASAYEMLPIANAYRGQRPVYAVDLPGFGFSERADRPYSPEMYTRVIHDLVLRIGEPVDLVALSLGAEFAARAALDLGDRVRSLTLISPSGMGSRPGRGSQSASGSGAADVALSLFRFPLWSQAFYDLLATRASIRYFLQGSFVGEIDRGLLRYAYLTAHQRGARYAPLYFISGKLFTPDALTTLYERVTQPTLVLYDRDNFVGFDALPGLIERRPQWQAVRITPTLGLPHFERMTAVQAALDGFWGGLAGDQTP